MSAYKILVMEMIIVELVQLLEKAQSGILTKLVII